MDLLNRLVRTFAYVMAGITISTAVFITLFVPESFFPIELLWEIIIMSAVCSLGNFIYYSKEIISKKQMIFRIICHYIYINIIVFGLSFLWNWLEAGLIAEWAAMFLLITLVYAAVMIANFRQEEKIAERINQQLRKCNSSKEEEEDNKSSNLE